MSNIVINTYISLERVEFSDKLLIINGLTI